MLRDGSRCTCNHDLKHIFLSLKYIFFHFTHVTTATVYQALSAAKTQVTYTQYRFIAEEQKFLANSFRCITTSFWTGGGLTLICI